MVASVVDEILESQTWTNIRVFYMYRSMAFSLANLRIVFQGPLGHENERAFVEGDEDIPYGIFRALQIAFDMRWPAVERIREIQLSLDQESIRQHLLRTMTGRLEANGEKFALWLAKIGAVRDSPLHDEFIKAQLLFAVALVSSREFKHWDYEESVAFIGRKTWIYPFC